MSARNDLNAIELAEQRGVIWLTPQQRFDMLLQLEISRRVRPPIFYPATEPFPRVKPDELPTAA